MEWQAYVVAILFSSIGFACVLAIPIGLPGTWLLIGLAALVELADSLVLSGDDPLTFGWPLIAGCALLGVVGEAVEAGAGAAGTRLGGGTRRGMLGAIVGGVVGAIVLTLLLPVPLVGTLVGALLGTFVGALVGEATGARSIGAGRNLKAAFAATVGRLAGTLGKMAIASVVLVLLARAAFVA